MTKIRHGGIPSNPTFAGLTIDALNGLLKGAAGVVGVAAPGVDYEVPLAFQQSVVRVGNIVNLAGDAAVPGATQYYGTNALGVKGFFAVPLLAEVDPFFTAWLAAPPNVSIFTNDAGYIACGGVPACETDPAFTAWLAGPPNVSVFTNDAGYLTCAGVPACETDPAWAAWLAGPPNVSVFTNDAGYITGWGPEVDPIFAAWLAGSPLAGYVPYTGATGDVDLGVHNFTTTGTGTFNDILIDTATPPFVYPLEVKVNGESNFWFDAGGYFVVSKTTNPLLSTFYYFADIIYIYGTQQPSIITGGGLFATDGGFITSLSDVGMPTLSLYTHKYMTSNPALSPYALLIDDGAVYIDEDYNFYTQGFIMPTGASAGYVLTSDASGVGTWQAVAETDPVFTSWYNLGDPTISGTLTMNGGESIYLENTTGNPFIITASGNPSNRLSVDSETWIIGDTAYNNYGRVIFTAGTSGTAIMTVKDGGSVSSLTYLQDWRDASNNEVASVSKAGVFTGDGSGLTNIVYTETDPVYSANTYAVGMNQDVSTTGTPAFTSVSTNTIKNAGETAQIEWDSGNGWWTTNYFYVANLDAGYIDVNGNIDATGTITGGYVNAGNSMSTPEIIVQTYMTAQYYASVGYGGLDVYGKIWSQGGYDPPYILLDRQTKDQFLERIKFEVPQTKMNGLALWWRGDKLFGVTSPDNKNVDVYEVQMTKIASYAIPDKFNVRYSNRYHLDSMNGEIKQTQKAEPDLYVLKDGVSIDTGVFIKDGQPITKEDAIILTK